MKAIRFLRLAGAVMLLLGWLSVGAALAAEASAGATGAIAGVVRSAVTGERVVLSSVDVDLWSSAGGLVASRRVDGLGRYAFRGLAPGTYFLSTRSRIFFDQLHAGRPCFPSGSCDPTTGTPVLVAAGETVAGIDFSLSEAGSISGRLLESTTGQPVHDATISAFPISGEPDQRFALSDGQGWYRIQGLKAGGYKVGITLLSAYPYMLYPNVLCPDSPPPSGCDPAKGETVWVTDGGNTRGINFALPSLPSVAGFLTDASTGSPLSERSWLVAYYLNGEPVNIETPNANGHYRVPLNANVAGAPIRVLGVSFDHRDELFPDQPCEPPGPRDPWTLEPGCDLALGGIVEVPNGGTAEGVNLALTPSTGIAGSVLDADRLRDLPLGEPTLWSATGTQGPTFELPSAGRYTFEGLAPGTYFVSATAIGALAEVFDDLPCPGGPPLGCDVTTGTPVTVKAGALTPNVDLLLETSGSGFRGRVVAAGSGLPIEGVAIDVWNQDGSYRASPLTSADGRYRIDQLAPGSYWVSTATTGEWQEQIHPGVPCPRGSVYDGRCSLAAGVPVVVPEAPPYPRDLDFALLPSAIFADGFETGDLSAWASTVP